MKKIKRAMLVMGVIGIGALTACGGKDTDSSKELQIAIESQKNNGDSGEATHVVSITDGTMEMLSDSKSDVESILAEYGIAEEEGKKKGKTTDTQKEEMLKKISDLVEAKKLSLADSGITVKVGLNSHTIDLEANDKAVLKGKESEINDLCALMGIYQRADSSKNDWTIRAYVKIYGENGEVAEDTSFGVAEGIPVTF